MSYGIGMPGPVGWGDADSWGGPEDGIDVTGGIGDVNAKKSAKVSSDTYMFIVVIVCLAILWGLGAGVFKSARM